MRRPPLSVFAALVIALGLLAALHFRGHADPPFVAGAPEPGMRFLGPEGGEVSLASYRPHVVVMNFWATWCAPCLAELPSLDRLHRALGRDGLVVLAVSVDDASVDAAAFVASRGLTLPVLRDPGGREAAARLQVDGYPTTFVVDGAGRLQARYLGVADWDLPEALDHFRGLLKESASPTR